MNTSKPTQPINDHALKAAEELGKKFDIALIGTLKETESAIALIITRHMQAQQAEVKSALEKANLPDWPRTINSNRRK